MIEGNKIILRPLIPDDAPFTLELRHDLPANQALLGYPYPVNIENEKRWISKLYTGKYREHIYLAIVEKETREFIGYVSAKNIDFINSVASFGIILRKNSRSKGYSKEAMELFLKYLFNVFNIRKITLEVIANNENAIRLYMNCGFQKEGVLKKHIWQNDKYLDLLIMSKFLP